MKDLSRKLKCWFKNGAYLSLAVLFIFMGLGCASAYKTTKTETTVNHPNKGMIYQGERKSTTTVSTAGDHRNEDAVEISETTTTTTTTETKAEHPGILSSTFHAIGYVIALPFIIIGGLFRMIFGG